MFFFFLQVCSVERILKLFFLLIFIICGLPEVSGPPEFLNNSVEEFAAPRDVDQPRGGRRNRREKKDLPTGMAQLLSVRLWS